MVSVKEEPVMVALIAFLRGNVVDPIDNRPAGQPFVVGSRSTQIDVARPMIVVVPLPEQDWRETGLGNLGKYVNRVFDIEVYVNSRTESNATYGTAIGSHLAVKLKDEVQKQILNNRDFLHTQEGWLDIRPIGSQNPSYSEAFDYYLASIRVIIEIEIVLPVA